MPHVPQSPSLLEFAIPLLLANMLLCRLEPLISVGAEKQRPVYAAYCKGGRRLHVGIAVSPPAPSYLPKLARLWPRSGDMSEMLSRIINLAVFKRRQGKS